MECVQCGNRAIKSGLQKNGAQRYKCNNCNIRFQEAYTYDACKPKTNTRIVKLIKEGMGIRNVSRYLGISPTTTIKRIKAIASKIRLPLSLNTGSAYEIDEMQTVIGSKENKCWVIYALERATNNVTDFTVGSRSKENIKPLIDNILARNPMRIYTDKWNAYPSLIPTTIHSTSYKQTNHIERFNLNLRINCKRLARKSICYSKSVVMLEAVLKIFFWG